MLVSHQACIGLGANLGDAVGSLQSALRALVAVDGITDVQASPLYRTPAWGRTDQPDFINGCARLTTTLAPLALLDALQAIESTHGRVRLPDQRWGPRTLDLDLLLYDGQVIDHPRLQVPHPWMHQRAFVLVPLADVAPNTLIPGVGSVADALLKVSGTSEVQRIGG